MTVITGPLNPPDAVRPETHREFDGLLEVDVQGFVPGRRMPWKQGAACIFAQGHNHAGRPGGDLLQ